MNAPDMRLVRALVVAAMLCTLSPVMAAAEEPCTVMHAQYGMIDFPALSAGFRKIEPHPDWLSDVAFYLHSAETDRTFWFLFDGGTGRYVYLHSTTDVTRKDWVPPESNGAFDGAVDGGERPLGTQHYLAADKDLRFTLEIPKSDSVAPAYILLPDLPEIMWYKAEPREGVPLAFLKLTDCAG